MTNETSCDGSDDVDEGDAADLEEYPTKFAVVAAKCTGQQQQRRRRRQRSVRKYPRVPSFEQQFMNAMMDGRNSHSLQSVLKRIDNGSGSCTSRRSRR
eukprot:CAMPEP_0119562600 /NCGR_PEP_ID=MMETSP1352-20130426/20965_1 /TAXON_ID=265584 /ORGANISM="Stauroneis constricta, Strain CCMP1120" /LENGTH=97 /DNA_ID=CAMNT_0007611037 /DNA_START=83 /DNA_END=376 /DNA_ORIENTATION=-